MLKISKQRIQLKLVKKVNPNIYIVSIALDIELSSKGILGSPITNKEKLSIKNKEALATTYRLKEIQDSNNKENNKDVKVKDIEDKGKEEGEDSSTLLQSIIKSKGIMPT